jgi:hypothetical protein
MSRRVKNCSPCLREQAEDFYDAEIERNSLPGSLSALRSVVTMLKRKQRCVVKVLQVNPSKKWFTNILWTLYLYSLDILRIFRLYNICQQNINVHADIIFLLTWNENFSPELLAPLRPISTQNITYQSQVINYCHQTGSSIFLPRGSYVVVLYYTEKNINENLMFFEEMVTKFQNSTLNNISGAHLRIGIYSHNGIIKSYSSNRTWRPIGLWDVEDSTFSLDNRLTDGDKVVSLTRRPPFTPPRRFLVLISVRGWVNPRA